MNLKNIIYVNFKNRQKWWKSKWWQMWGINLKIVGNFLSDRKSSLSCLMIVTVKTH